MAALASGQSICLHTSLSLPPPPPLILAFVSSSNKFLLSHKYSILLHTTAKPPKLNYITLRPTIFTNFGPTGGQSTMIVQRYNYLVCTRACVRNSICDSIQISRSYSTICTTADICIEHVHVHVCTCMKLELVPGSCTRIYMHIIWSLAAHIGVKIRGCDSQSEGWFMVISSTCMELGHTEWRENRVAGLVLASSPTSFPAIHTFFIQCMHAS